MTRNEWKISKLEYDGEIFTVESWWDRQSRNWITYLLSPEEFQIGDANYVYQKSSAQSAHKEMVDNAPAMIADWKKDRAFAAETANYFRKI